MNKTPQAILTAEERAVIDWRVSSWSGDGSGGTCVAVGRLPDGRIAVRHSHHPDGQVVVYSPDEWTAFVAGVQAGEFDF